MSKENLNTNKDTKSSQDFSERQNSKTIIIRNQPETKGTIHEEPPEPPKDRR